MTPYQRFSDHAPAVRRLTEVVIVGLLMALLVGQMLSYPPTDDPDPDGFVSYAQHLRATGTLMESRRLPGYPAFLAIVSTLGPRPIARNVYWVQLVLMAIVALAAWVWVRAWLGPLTAVLFLGILAAPSFFTRMAVVMLPDVLYSLLFVPVLLLIGWWVLAARPAGGWLWLPAIAGALFVLQTLRPTTFVLSLLLGPALVAGLLVRRRVESWPPPLLPGLLKIAALMAVAVLVFVAVDRTLDTGARAYNASVPLYRAVIYLPPASNSPADQRIEAAKRRFQEIEGQPIDRARFLTYLTYQFYDELPLEDVQQVAVGRLLAHPGLYVLSVLEDLKLGHYLLARTMVPFFLDLDRLPLFRVLYPPDDGSERSQVFRRTGLIVLESEPYPAMFPLQVEVGYAAARLVAVWGLLVLGVWQLARQFPGLTVASVVLAGLFVLMTAATNTVDARYLLPFMLPGYLAEAVGMTWIARALLFETD
ncbi:MAG: hypothetical protein AB7P40_01350 [Chloroflexota bacterium]